MKISGLITALVTPFMNTGALDLERFQEHIREQIDCGVKGLVVLGTTGEAPTLSDREKEELVKTAADACCKRIPLIVGCGLSGTKATIEAARLYEPFADAFMIVAPSYCKPTQQGIFAHFKAIAEQVKRPVILYNNPGRSGVAIEMHTILELSKIKGIIGLKDSSGNLLDTAEIIAKKPAQFQVFAGDDPYSYPSLAMGACGLISVTANALATQMLRLVHNRDLQLFLRLLPLFRALFKVSNPIPIKALMELIGKPVGSCRLPLYPLNVEEKQDLLQIYKDIDLKAYA